MSHYSTLDGFTDRPQPDPCDHPEVRYEGKVGHTSRSAFRCETCNRLIFEQALPAGSTVRGR